MRSLTITLLLTLTLTSCYGGVTRRSLQNKPFQNGKELLALKGASDVIKRSFETAGSGLEALAEGLEMDDLATAIRTLDLKVTERLGDLLTEGKNIKSVIEAHREEQRGVAKEAIRFSERILQKFNETIAGSRELDRGMRSILRDMRRLLRLSEMKLREAGNTISTLREKINRVTASLSLFKGMSEAVKMKEEALGHHLASVNTGELFTGIVADLKHKYPQLETDEKKMRIVNSLLDGITSLTASIVKNLEKPSVVPQVNKALSKIEAALYILTKQKQAVDKVDLEKDVELIIIMRETVQHVMDDVFPADPEVRKEEQQGLFNEIKEIIEGGDVEEIYEAYNGLKDAAQNYLI